MALGIRLRLLGMATLTSCGLAVVACGGDRPSNTSPTQRLVDLFDQGGTEVVDSPTLTLAPRAAWRFEDAPDGPLGDGGWVNVQDVGNLRVADGRLTGEATSAMPVLRVDWNGSSGADDRRRSVEIELRASAGANLDVDLLDEDDTVDTEDWGLNTPIIPGDELRTYSIPNEGNTDASDIRQIAIRPTDESGATFEIASVRLLFDREHLAETPSGVGWHGLAEIYHESLVAKSPEIIQIPVTLPNAPWLDLSIGTFEEGPLTFRVEITGAGSDATLLERTLTTPDQWQTVPIELDAFAGQRVTLNLGLTGPRDGAIGLWGSPAIRNHGTAPPGETATGDAPPQGVVLIMADTIRRGHLGAYGYARDTTPTLSRLASDGVLFRDAISQATWTKVSTPSILTSMYPASHTVKTVPDRLPSSATTLAEVFRTAGYATLSLSSVTFTGQSSNLHQGFEVLHEAASRTGEKQGKSARQYVDRLLPWLDAHHDTPFFAFVHIFDPHSPFEPRPPYNTMWAAPEKKARFEEQLAAVREHIDTAFMRNQGMATLAELAAAEVDAGEFIGYAKDWYDGSIRGMDAEIGRVIEHLDTLGLTGRTLVAFVGDHGEEFHEHGRMWHGHSVYGELTNVPLLLWQPGTIPSGPVVEETVRTIDLMPTILEIADLTTPEVAQGQSLTPLFVSPQDGGASDWITRPVVAEEHIMGNDDEHESYALLLDGWRLIRNVKMPEDDHAAEFELYRHSGDPLALEDVAAANPDVVERLAKELDRWRQQTDAARLPSDEELSSTLSADELRRLRSLGYVR